MSNDKSVVSEQGDLGFIKLTAFSVGTTLASGIFSISGDLAANGANTLAVIIGWLIAGLGMFGLVMCYFGLNRVRPDLNSGIYSYAREGFGDYLGFSSAWGYWLGCILTNVSFATLLFSAIGYFFPIFGAGNNLASVLASSILIWVCAFLVLRGVKEATTLNVIIVAAKIIPIMVMLVAIVFVGAFDIDIFMHNFAGEAGGLSLVDQIKATTPTTMWCFVGVESVVVISRRSKKSKDAGTATVTSFLSLLAIYILISVLSMGVMTREELATLGNPPMSGVMEHVVGSWGAALVNIAVIISLLGAIFTYTIFSTESAYQPAVEKCFPKFFAKENKNQAPSTSLIISNLIVQFFLIILLINESTYQIFYTFASSFMLIPYLLSALFYVKVLFKNENNLLSGYSLRNIALQKFFAILGTIYSLWLLYSLGFEYTIIASMLYAPGTILYIISKREQGKKPFTNSMDIAFLIVIIAAAILSAVLIANGTIAPF